MRYVQLLGKSSLGQVFWRYLTLLGMLASKSASAAQPQKALLSVS